MSLKKGIFKKTTLIFALVILISQEVLLHAQEYEATDESTTTEEIITTEETSISDDTISTDVSVTEEGISYISEELLQETSNSNEHFLSIQSGSQNAVSDNFKTPLSAWKLTSATFQEFSFYDPFEYQIRLEELYIGNEAYAIIKDENNFVEKPDNSSQWIIMKFYLKNNGTKELSASDIIFYYSSFYTSSGTSLTIKDTELFMGERSNMSIYDLRLMEGASGYFWIGILVDKSVGYPYIKINNGYDKSEYEEKFCWLNTDPSYVYNSSTNISNTSGSVNMYRLYNPNSGEHFYTANSSERDILINIGWNYEGIAWKAPIKSNTPVYRLYNENAGDHHYTMSASEKDFLISIGWKYEGIGWYSDDFKSVPLYRQYNPNAITGSHNYTTNKSENDWLVTIGWDEEGIGWYGLK